MKVNNRHIKYLAYTMVRGKLLFVCDNLRDSCLTGSTPLDKWYQVDNGVQIEVFQIITLNSKMVVNEYMKEKIKNENSY